MSDEPIFSSWKDGIEITATTARFGDRSYPIEDITGVQTYEAGFNRAIVGIGALAVSIIALFLGAFIVGVFAAGIAIAMTYRTKTMSKYSKAGLRLLTEKGDEEVLESANAELVGQVKRAIEQAVALRG